MAYFMMFVWGLLALICPVSEVPSGIVVSFAAFSVCAAICQGSTVIAEQLRVNASAQEDRHAEDREREIARELHEHRPEQAESSP